ncbi:MAG: Na+/H+ antiporter subunit E [Bacillota bacterium]|nr:Na+/H+ antiporter subunit E [Bacillota bacterium]MDW7677758.1 Na+/H+ antiporter subunit E [Bacillota bacterium]
MIPFTLLMAFWLILSPNITQQSVFIGLVVSFLVVMYSRDILFDSTEMPLYQMSHLMNMLHFVGILLIEIVKANIDVAKIVLNPALPIQPQFIRVPMMLKNDINKVIYGNSVTLTPGTLTVDLTEEYFVIHALTDEAAAAMNNSFIEQWVLRLEESDL